MDKWGIRPIRYYATVGDRLKTWEVVPTAAYLNGGTMSFHMDTGDLKEDLSGMVIVARSSDCDINLIESRNKVMVCLSCPLTREKEDFRTNSSMTMYRHLELHVEIGQKVPVEVRAKLLLRGADALASSISETLLGRLRDRNPNSEP